MPDFAPAAEIGSKKNPKSNLVPIAAMKIFLIPCTVTNAGKSYKKSFRGSRLRGSGFMSNLNR